MKRIVILILTICSSFEAYAQVPIVEPDYDKSSYICPNFFGPYAFPVPDQLEAQVSDKLLVELSGDAVIGKIGGKDNKDYTYAPTFKLKIPLWTDRVNLSIWGEMHEWYKDTRSTRQARRVDSKYDLKRNDSGNIYLSIDILALREKKYCPSIAIRAATLTATGDDYETARHYDAPGYFFDVGIGKSFTFLDESFFRVSASAGFLCWQTDLGRQNDATMIGVMASYNHKIFNLSAEYAQYKGWEDCYDYPQVFKTRLNFNIKRFSPFFYYAHGIQDWPFDQFRLGLAVKFGILHNTVK